MLHEGCTPVVSPPKLSDVWLHELLAGINDAEAIPEPACMLVKQLVAGAWADVPEAEQLVETAISTRQQRAETYVT